ncbi:hypothetical protein OG455_23635 [Kitasatospora sp. NBC_01287]|uniref:hypothetical protein n=1 Tax=Kitasatospora sp. NBC_01287 TaxID=2903573 RepID=UPI00224D3660|nr:hypothetical protein [Kitasatospora sp. NBC_01287]MCX4748469.1 hypothetical protein [Kitasatospora sp. NBC_01287]
MLLEAAVSIAAALLTTWLARFVDTNPMSRIGQVSGLAALQLQLLLLMLIVVLALVPAMRRGRVLSVRFAAAAFAGLATGVTAAGVAVALRGTPWPLNAQTGDSGQLQIWAQQLMQGKPMDGTYPPLFPHIVSWYAQAFAGGDVGFALKMVDLGFTALLGPVAYLTWRLLLPPLWSLGLGVVAALPLMDPYKPYTAFVLVGLLPVLAKLLHTVQRAAELGRREAMIRGGAIGLVVGVMFLLYSGWFVWSAAGLTLLTVVLLYRLGREGGGRALLTGLVVLGSTVVVFLLTAGTYLTGFLASSAGAVDRYCYFDVYTEPSYFAMWQGDLPGSATMSTWPLPGELGGVGLFVLLLLVGAGLAVVLAPRNPAVLTAAAAALSAFVMRYWYASQMFKNDAVMLYPRTSAQLLYCFLVLVGFAVYLGAQRFQAWRREAAESSDTRGLSAGHTSIRVAVAALCSLGLLFGMAGSATASKYMPDNPEHSSDGSLAWIAQTQGKLDGGCPTFAPGGKCHPSQKLQPPTTPAPPKTTLNCSQSNPYPARGQAPLGRLVALLGN